MNIFEFIFLILGVISLIDYIVYTFIMYQCKELINIFGTSTEIKIRRYIEFLIIIITTAIITYKFIS